MSVEGFLESRDTLQVRGWAYDSERPGRHVDVEILCDGRPLGQVTANFYRHDLAESKIGEGDHAFIFNLDPPLSRDELEQLTARALMANVAPIPLATLSAAATIASETASLPSVEFPGICRDETHWPVFILGSARSGTSAIAQGLTAATRYCGQEEGHFLEVLAPLFVHLHTFYNGKSDEFVENRNTMIARVPERFMKDALRGAAIAAARQLFPGGYWIEKTPNANMIHLAPRLREIWPNARFIFMKRRAIENVASRLRKFPYDFAHNCREWAEAMEAWLSVRDQMAGTALELDQHFLANAPSEAAAAVAKLLHLNSQETTRLGQALKAARPQQTSAHFSEAIGLADTSWGQTNLELFRSICGPMMKAYGYALSASYFQEDVSDIDCVGF